MSRFDINQRFDEMVAFAGVRTISGFAGQTLLDGNVSTAAFAVAALFGRISCLYGARIGDTEFQRKCLGKVEGVAREGRTVILVSHNLGAVTRLLPEGVVAE